VRLQVCCQSPASVGQVAPVRPGSRVSAVNSFRGLMRGIASGCPGGSARGVPRAAGIADPMAGCSDVLSPIREAERLRRVPSAGSDPASVHGEVAQRSWRPYRISPVASTPTDFDDLRVRLSSSSSVLRRCRVSVFYRAGPYSIPEVSGHHAPRLGRPRSVGMRALVAEGAKEARTSRSLGLSMSRRRLLVAEPFRKPGDPAPRWP